MRLPLLNQKSVLSCGVASCAGKKLIHLCLDLHCQVAFPERVTSRQGGLSKEVPLCIYMHVFLCVCIYRCLYVCMHVCVYICGTPPPPKKIKNTTVSTHFQPKITYSLICK